MAKTHKFKQCKMWRKIPEGQQVYVAWIPASFAKPGKTLKLKFNDEWVDGWVVKEVGQEKELGPDNHTATMRNHRKRTGDDLPKNTPNLT
jgi:hypothetical protein